MESSKASRTTGRGATAAGLAERNTRLNAEHVVSGGPDAWRRVYSLMRCPGPPCDLGPFCWQDPKKNRHYELLGHNLRNPVKFVQRGSKLESQDVRTQLYAEQQQHQDRSGSVETRALPRRAVLSTYLDCRIRQ